MSSLHGVFDRVWTCCASGAAALVLAACGSGSVQGTNFGGSSGPAGGAGGAAGSVGMGGGMAGTSTGTGAGGDGIIVVPGDGGSSSPSACVNLQCNQTTCTAGACTQRPCSAGAKTTISGTVYDPAGKVPLYNVIVYVPNSAVAPIVNGASCDKCSAMAVNPVVSALTDTHGHFVLEDAPVGDNVPLVIQVGKWRRQITVANVPACTETALMDPNQTRLPRNRSEGDIPLIAITTGGADSMECLPRRMGLDDSEFSTEAGTGHIHLYAGMNNGNSQATSQFAPTLNGGAVLTPAATVWGDVTHLRAYDIVILSCEGALLQQEKPATARQALYDYESLGGRVFASHWHRYWFSDGPMPVPTVGTWRDNNDPPTPIDGTIDTTFPKGMALSDWLVNVGASTTPGMLSILEARDNVQAVNGTIAQQWITIQAPAARQVAAHTAIEFLSFNAPLAVPDAMQCGRAVFNDLHVSSTGMDMPGQPFPMGCEVRDLTSQEKAVEFLLFDLSSCVQNDKMAPMPPVVK